MLPTVLVAHQTRTRTVLECWIEELQPQLIRVLRNNVEVHLQLILEYLKSSPDKLSRSSRFRGIYMIYLFYSGRA